MKKKLVIQSLSIIAVLSTKIFFYQFTENFPLPFSFFAIVSQILTLVVFIFIIFKV